MFNELLRIQNFTLDLNKRSKYYIFTHYWFCWRKAGQLHYILLNRVILWRQAFRYLNRLCILQLLTICSHATLPEQYSYYKIPNGDASILKFRTKPVYAIELHWSTWSHVTPNLSMSMIIVLVNYMVFQDQYLNVFSEFMTFVVVYLLIISDIRTIVMTG